MSLLGTQVFANPDTPIWLSSAGGVITGSLTVEGEVVADEGFVTYDAPAGGLTILNAAGTQQQTRLVHVPAPTSRTILQTNDPLFFNQVGATNGNTSLTISAAGANTDSLTVGGGINAVGNDGFRVFAAGAPPVSKMFVGNVANQSFIESADTLFFAPLTGIAKTSLAMAAAPADDVFTTDSVVTKKLTLEDTGAAATVGSGTLALGTAIINTTASDVTSYILLTHTNLNATTAVGTLRISNKGANDFTVVSVDATGATELGDLSDFDWMIVNPA